MIQTLAITVLKSSHTAFIAGAWAVAVSVLLGVLLQSLIAARRNRARLAMLEKTAPRRQRGQAAGDTDVPDPDAGKEIA